jgi:hypothetical protein
MMTRLSCSFEFLQSTSVTSYHSDTTTSRCSRANDLLPAVNQSGSAVIGGRYGISQEIAYQVQVDVKPNDTDNVVNHTSEGVIPVAIISTAALNTSDHIDRTSLTFGVIGDEKSLVRCSVQDVNRDDISDLMCHFDTQKTGLSASSYTAVLRGRTWSGVLVEGWDWIFVNK